MSNEGLTYTAKTPFGREVVIPMTRAVLSDYYHPRGIDGAIEDADMKGFREWGNGIMDRFMEVV
jgi:hypothetical protein